MLEYDELLQEYENAMEETGEERCELLDNVHDMIQESLEELHGLLFEHDSPNDCILYSYYDRQIDKVLELEKLVNKNNELE